MSDRRSSSKPNESRSAKCAARRVFSFFALLLAFSLFLCACAETDAPFTFSADLPIPFVSSPTDGSPSGVSSGAPSEDQASAPPSTGMTASLPSSGSEPPVSPSEGAPTVSASPVTDPTPSDTTATAPTATAPTASDTTASETTLPYPNGRAMPDCYLRGGFAEPTFRAPQSFVYDVTGGRFLYLNGNAEEICPASTTKLLTILCARTLLPLDLVVAPGDELDLVRPNSSLAYIRNDKGHKLTVEQLIEGMLLPSGNDAAYALAAAAGRAIDPSAADGKTAVAAFIRYMNDYAASLGLRGSRFLTPDGYHTEGHYSSLEDMALVASLAYHDEIIRKYCNTPTDTVTYASGHIMEWSNTNWCIDPYSPEYYVPEMNGMKTGAKGKGYYCLIGSAEISGRAYVFGFFGETIMTDRFLDAKDAVKWIKDHS